MLSLERSRIEDKILADQPLKSPRATKEGPTMNVTPALAGVNDDPMEVLVTGFGPFSSYKENPSWLAVKLLHDTTIYYDCPILPAITANGPALLGPLTKKRAIHISTLQIPVSYEAVLAIVPGLHQTPPALPNSDDPDLSRPDPPKQGFDLVLHVGVAGRGPLRVERQAHKLNYNMRDADYMLAPIAFVPPTYGGSGMISPMDAERLDRQRHAADTQALSATVGKTVPEISGPIVRGFGEEYREFPDEMQTDIDVERLVADIKLSGPEDVFTTCYMSLDAGHYLCDYIYYCSLAEAKRTTTKKGRSSKVLFIHCPPVNLPFSSEEVAEALRRMIVWMCGTI